MDDVCGRNSDGHIDVGGRNVPAVASCDAAWRVVSKYRDAGAHWLILRDCGGAANILCNYHHRGESRNMDIS